jgi:hypothetical protein
MRKEASLCSRTPFNPDREFSGCFRFEGRNEDSVCVGINWNPHVNLGFPEEYFVVNPLTGIIEYFRIGAPDQVPNN